MPGIASLRRAKRLVLSSWKARHLIQLRRALTLVYESLVAARKLHASDGSTLVGQCLSKTYFFIHASRQSGVYIQKKEN